MSNLALTKDSVTRSSNPTRNQSSNPTTQQSQITLDDVNASVAAAASSELARQAPLLPPINIAPQGYPTRTRSTRARPTTDSPTAMDTQIDHVSSPVIHPPPKKRKPAAAPDPASTTSKPPKTSKKGKQKATTPSPHPAQSPSRKSSPIQKLASALISRLPVVFTRDSHRGQSSTAPPLGAEPTTESPPPLTQYTPAEPHRSPTVDNDPLLTVKQSELEEIVARMVREQSMSHHAPLPLDTSNDEDLNGNLRFVDSPPSTPGKFYCRPLREYTFFYHPSFMLYVYMY
jgi:hypothetical protein